MESKKILLFLSFNWLLLSVSFAQSGSNFKWWNPVNNPFPVIEGQGWPGELQAPYDRLPAKAEKMVRSPVWDLSRHSAGLLMRFTSDASEITVRYVLTASEEYGFPHMPATGVSGVDLYGLKPDGEWLWGIAKYSFGDTIVYRYTNLDKQPLKEYRLYLPLYNNVEWLEIGVPSEDSFTPLPVRPEMPIVIYGTSITQGGCASRPGMAWTSMVERNLNTPVINLGFSGEGKLDDEVIDLIVELDAKLFILDNLPNLDDFPDEEIHQRIIKAVKKIRAEHPSAPILLVDNPGAAIGSVNSSHLKSYKKVNRVLDAAFLQMNQAGVKNLYRLTSSDIGFDEYSTVDGSHPTDLGMRQYAVAFEKMIKSILKTN